MARKKQRKKRSKRRENETTKTVKTLIGTAVITKTSSLYFGK